MLTLTVCILFTHMRDEICERDAHFAFRSFGQISHYTETHILGFRNVNSKMYEDILILILLVKHESLS